MLLIYKASFSTLLLFVLLAYPCLSQKTRSGIIHVKFKENRKPHVTVSQRGEYNLGIDDIDHLNHQLGLKKIKRVFRESGKFEKAHRQFGLHLWYELEFDPSIPLDSTIAVFKKLTHFEKIESCAAYEPIFSQISGDSSTTKNPDFPDSIDDPLFERQWHYQNLGQTGGTPGADISLPQAWTLETGKPEIIVAVIDGGIDVKHPDLSSVVWKNTKEIPGNNLDDDNNGYIDDVNGYGFGDNTGTIYPHFHATHVGGTIGAVNNNETGVCGIAGGTGLGGVTLMSCAGFGEFAVGGFEDAMIYAADNGAVISQNSWGGGSSAIEAAIDYFVARAGYDNGEENFSKNIQTGPMAGGIVIFAAGNSNTSDPTKGYPASYKKVMAVASTDFNDQKSYFSNYGNWVDISAPGSAVYSTYPVSMGGYATLSGTSMACPHVSGVAALIISKFHQPGFTPSEVLAKIQTTADNIDEINPGFNGLLGSGRLSAFNALQTPNENIPDAITDLKIIKTELHDITVQWTAPGVNGKTGAASYYEIRYSAQPITDSNYTLASIAQSPKPFLSGTEQQTQISNLAYSTTYYIAIKAFNFFGNSSSLSNIVMGTTLDPPIIKTSPSSFTVDLFTGEASVKYLSISNVGFSNLTAKLTSELNYDSPNSEDPPHIFFVQSSLMLPPGPYPFPGLIVFNAYEMPGGTYSGFIHIASNDPFQTGITIPVTFNIKDAPDIDLNKEPVVFQKVYLNSYGEQRISITNRGTKILEMNKVEVSGAEFEATLSKTQIEPRETVDLNVKFSPLFEGTETGLIQIATNDPDEGLIKLDISGKALNAPVGTISPDKLPVTIFRNDFLKKELTISNSGGDSLRWQLNDSLPSYLKLAKTYGIIPMGGKDTISLSFNSHDTSLKNDTLHLHFIYNTPFQSVLEVPIVLNVIVNQPPFLIKSIPSQLMDLKSEPVTIRLIDYFMDEPGEKIIFSHEMKKDTIVRTLIVNDDLIIIPLFEGETNFHVRAEDRFGAFTESTVNISVISGVEKVTLISWPNPFTHSTTISYYLPDDEHVQLALFDLTGKEIITLINTNQAKGKKELLFSGSHLLPGVYLLRLIANQKQTILKLIKY